MQANSSLSNVSLADGTEPFNGDLLGAIPRSAVSLGGCQPRSGTSKGLVPSWGRGLSRSRR